MYKVKSYHFVLMVNLHPYEIDDVPIDLFFNFYTISNNNKKSPGFSIKNNYPSAMSSLPSIETQKLIQNYKRYVPATEINPEKRNAMTKCWHKTRLKIATKNK